MAETAAAKEARLIHFSTDYVFDGAKTTPYAEEDIARPLGHYGQTKLAGEGAALMPSPRHMAVRVSWVFGPDKRVLWIRSSKRALAIDRVEAIADKTSCMTFTEDVARWLSAVSRSRSPRRAVSRLQHGRVFLARIRPVCAGFRRAAGLPLKARKAEPIPLSAMKRSSHRARRTTVLSTQSLPR